MLKIKIEILNEIHEINIILEQNEIIINNEIKDLKNRVNLMKELIKENKSLKSELNETKVRLDILSNAFYDYINKNDLNCIYNLFDVNLYKLEDLYNTIDHDIIKYKEDLGFINYGLKDIRKNINKMRLKYKASIHGKNLKTFVQNV